MTSAWPFLVGRGRYRDYRTILVPDLLAGPGAPAYLADALPISNGPGGGPSRTNLVHPELGPLVVTAAAATLRPHDIPADPHGEPARTDDGDYVADEHGRPIEYLYGLVSHGADPGAPGDLDMRTAHREALASYRRFLAGEHAFLFDRSGPLDIPALPPPALQPPPTAPPEPARHPQRLPSGALPARPSDPRRPGRPTRPQVTAWALAAAAALVALLIVVLLRGGDRAGIQDLRLDRVTALTESCSPVQLVVNATIELDTTLQVSFQWRKDGVELQTDRRNFEAGSHPLELPVTFDDDKATSTTEAPEPFVELAAIQPNGTELVKQVPYRCAAQPH